MRSPNTGPCARPFLHRAPPYHSNKAVKLSDESDLGISTETIAPPGHTLGLCPKGMIWFKVIRAVTATEYGLLQVRQFWIQAPLPRDLDEVKQYLALVRKRDRHVTWMFLYLSELTPQHLEWFTRQDWENVQAWLASARTIQSLREALELCRQQHEANAKAPTSVLALDASEDFAGHLT